MISMVGMRRKVYLTYRGIEPNYITQMVCVVVVRGSVMCVNSWRWKCNRPDSVICTAIRHTVPTNKYTIASRSIVLRKINTAIRSIYSHYIEIPIWIPYVCLRLAHGLSGIWRLSMSWLVYEVRVSGKMYLPTSCSNGATVRSLYGRFYSILMQGVS